MAYINFDDKLLTWIRFFDSNNKLLVEWLNVLESKQKNSTIKSEWIISILAKFKEIYINITESEKDFMESHNYNNQDYMVMLHKIQVKNLENIFNKVNNSSYTITITQLEQLKEMVLNNINLDKSSAKFLQRKYKQNLDAMMF